MQFSRQAAIRECMCLHSCVCLCIYVCVCVYIYIYIYIHIHTHTYAVFPTSCDPRVYVPPFLRMYVCECIYIYMLCCTHIYVCLHKRTHTDGCMYVGLPSSRGIYVRPCKIKSCAAISSMFGCVYICIYMLCCADIWMYVWGLTQQPRDPCTPMQEQGLCCH